MTAALLVSVTACSSYEDYCTEQVDCVGGNDQDQEVCVIQQDLAEERADIQGCLDDYEALFDCFEENASCSGNQWTAGDNCNAEQEAYTKCSSD